jgi:pantoate kinase
MKEINRAGETAVKELLQRPTLKQFMKLSSRFTKQIDLGSPWVLDAIEAVEAAGGMASMIMLGDAVFSVGGEEGAEALSEFGKVGRTTVSHRGANLD